MFIRTVASSLCAALLAVTAQQASAQASSKDQWRIGLGRADLHYSGSAAEILPSHQPSIELGWTRHLSGPWSLRAGFVHAPNKHRQTQHIVPAGGGITHTEDKDISARINVFQLGFGYTLAEGRWGQLTAMGMLTHSRMAIQGVENDTIVSGGTTTYAPVYNWRYRGNSNRLTVGLEYQLPGVESMGGVAPYVQIQKFTADGGMGGKPFFISAGLAKSF